MSPLAAPASQPVLPDELLEDIFLRLDATADLARASAACTTFRRVVSGRRFQRRFRSLHPLPVLGFLEFDAPGKFHPAEPPLRSAPPRALAQAADFTFSFLPGAPNSWRVCDARDGRVLLYRRDSISITNSVDLVVCDPLHRRYVQLPPVPDDLVAATGSWGSEEYNLFHRQKKKEEFDFFLDPATDREKEDEQDFPFRVICAVQRPHELVTFHFSSVAGKWRCIRFDRSPPLNPTAVGFELFERLYAHNCFYWRFFDMGRLDILDTRQMKFSVLDKLPVTKADPLALGIVETGEGRLSVVSVSDGILVLKPLGNKNNGVDTEEWQHDKMIPLPQMDCYWRILSTAEGYLLLQAIPKIPFATLESQYFTLDLKTLLIERLCGSNQRSRGAHPCASFPHRCHSQV